jgi:hypothetical protein
MERPALYSLSLTTDLGLDERHEAPDGLFNPVAIELIRGKLQRAFADTFYFAVEVGECGRLHAHVIACADSCLLDLPDDGETVKLIVKGTEYTTFKYFHKEAPQLPELIQAHKAAMKRTGGKLPFVRGFVRLERLQTTRRRLMWIGRDWQRTRKAVLERAASKVSLRTIRGFVRLERLQTTRRRLMWIGRDWQRTRKAVLERAASKVSLRTMRKPKSSYNDFYGDSPTSSYDVGAFLGIDPPTKRKRKRQVANVTALRA